MLPIISLGLVTLFSYPLFVGMGIGLCYVYIDRQNLYLKELSKKELQLFFWGSVLFAWLGAKVFFLLFSANSLEPLINNYNFWFGGGLVFYGGLIFALLYLLLICKITKIKFKKLSMFIPGMVLGHSVGRIGCLLAGCCYGSVTDSIFSIHLHGADRYPVQLYESLFLLIMFFILHIALHKKIKLVLPIYLVGYGIIRFALEFIRGDSIRGSFWGGFSTSQYVSFASVTIGAIIFFLRKRNNK